MPCPHNEITIVQRSQRQSAVAAAAYQSGEKLFCEYDQQVKHYPEKRGIVHNEILLPANAPQKYADRNTLWNAAEAVEKQWNSQLARRWVLTIPREIPPDQYAVLVREFCEQQFVSKGMIADFTVLIAANAPAKHAAKVSPITAVSGNAGHEKTMRHSPYVGFGKIESLLGVSHAISGKKNLFLMTGSFALSIILFLSFSIMVDFVDYLIPQSAATSDIDIASADGNAIPWELLTTIREMDGVKEVYGRRSVFDVSAKLNDDTNFSGTVDLISYDDFDLQCLKKDSALKRGSDLSKVFGDSNFVLATSDQDSTWKIGDTVQIGDETLTIAGLLKNDPFSENGLTNGKLTLITSDETFVRLTGEEGYSLVLIQTTGDVTDENVQAIQNSVDQTYSFRDKRDERTTGTYMAFVFCVYAFLAIIALVTVMNIVNSISMSVSARMKQYGAMRAVGMDERQMTKMIACEAFTYAVLGCVVGCAIGLPLSKSLYDFLIAGHFPSAVWQFPITSLGVILLFVSIAAIAAVYAPAKRIRNMSITATINEL